MDIEKVISFAKTNKEEFKNNLIKMAKIPSVSADGYPPEEVAKSAEEVANQMKFAGLTNVEVITFPNAHPYAYGEYIFDDKAPTILLYAHHDVQPPGKLDKWITGSPWEPKEIDGRLYGRGVVDDKAGAMIHLAAIRSYIQTENKLPINIKMIVEGEEEIGSTHLSQFIEKYKDKLNADCIVLTDTANLYEGLPSITYLLRGQVGVDIEVKALKQQVHSGILGGPLPDSAMALCQLLATLKDDQGNLTIDGINNGVKILTKEERDRLNALPFDKKVFEDDAGLLDGAKMHEYEGISVYEQLWHKPALTVTALESCTLKESANQISESAKARLGLRIVPNQNPKEIRDILIKHLEKNKPEGVLLEITPTKSSTWWFTDYNHKAFDLACNALEKGYNKKPVFIGCGGTIPFVKPFSDNLGGVPCLLLGLEDPICHAHSENESLSLSDFYKAIDSAIYLYEELAKLS
ncbi:MAG: M20/M25/M40 family metallo-hydrolase [Candidatus Sericytochromatia bacterium]